MPKTNKASKLFLKRHSLIPGAAHTYSKGDDQFSSNAPPAIVRGKGAYVWGSDGKKYLDWCMGLRSVILGHVNVAVNQAVSKQMSQGTNFGRPHPIEFELADYLCKILPNVQMVKFAKNGSTVTTAATKLARAFTGRKYIAVCSSHPFFSYDDWFIGTTLCNAGIPEETKKLSLTFKYNDFASVEKIFKEHPGEIACVIMEVVTTEEPRDNFLHRVQELIKKNGAVFIIDEMITGFRFALKGAQSLYGLKPDLTTYGKGVANGYSVAVLGGRKDIMELGGIKHDKERVFLVSTTHGAETIGLAAAMATLKILEKNNVYEQLVNFGAMLKDGLVQLIAAHGLADIISVSGFPQNFLLQFNDVAGTTSFVLKTIFLQEVTKRGVLFQGYFPISYSHRAPEIKKTLAVFDASFKEFKKMVATGSHEKYLLGPAVKPVFRKYN